MITVLLVNLVGVMIYVAGVGMCMRTAKRTGNHGYLLMAAYFVAALIVTSLNQVREFERGPQVPEDLYAAPEAQQEEKGAATEMQKADEGTLSDKAAEPVAGEPDKTVDPDEGAVSKAAEPAEGEAKTPTPPEEVGKEPVPNPDSLLTVSPPILPALLLAAVWLISRDDPRRGKEQPEEGTEAAGDDRAGTGNPKEA